MTTTLKIESIQKSLTAWSKASGLTAELYPEGIEPDCGEPLIRCEPFEVFVTEGESKGMGGSKPVMQFCVTVEVYCAGNRDEPPSSDYKDIGTYPTVWAALNEIACAIFNDKLQAAMENDFYAQNPESEDL